MRTTLVIDDDVLTAAKELAKARNTTAGEVISDLVRKALTAPPSFGGSGPGGTYLKNGWYVLPHRGGPPVTSELVRQLLEDADLEDAGLRPSDD
jgi:hypothetical protein